MRLALASLAVITLLVVSQLGLPRPQIAFVPEPSEEALQHEGGGEKMTWQASSH